jgi:UDP-glucose 4-epimerase
MQALVTGGAGFIGSNLVDALLERGDDVVVVDNLSTGKEENLAPALERGVSFELADIVDAERVRELFATYDPEIVYHLAAQISVNRSVTDPPFDARTNVEGTINILEAARHHGGVRIVNTSTGGAIYGETEVLPTPEETVPRPEAPYGQAKYCAEGYCGLYERLFEVPSITLRYGNVYGPRQDPMGEAGVVAIFCGRLRDGKPPRVNGDGKQTRDYVYVGDVVQANLAAAARPDVSGVFNVGTGRESSVLDIVDALREIAGADWFVPEYGSLPPGEVPRSCLDISAARAQLGWEPRVALLDGLRQTLEAPATA